LLCVVGGECWAVYSVSKGQEQAVWQMCVSGDSGGERVTMFAWGLQKNNDNEHVDTLYTVPSLFLSPVKSTLLLPLASDWARSVPPSVTWVASVVEIVGARVVAHSPQLIGQLVISSIICERL
jgi:hypothetical protein